MAYTKTQLVNAFCEAQNYNAEDDGTKSEFITAWIAKRDENRQRRIDRHPTGMEQAVNVAIEHLLQTTRDENTSATLE